MAEPEDIKDDPSQRVATRVEPPESTLERVTPVFLTRRGNTRVCVALTYAPWDLGVEAFVIPTGATGDLGGGLAQALLTQITDGSVQTEMELWIKTTVSDSLQPASPLLMPLGDLAASARASAPPDSILHRLPQYAILATAFGDGQSGSPTPSVENAATAAREITRLAGDRQFSRIAITLLGSGSGELDSGEVAIAMLRAILSTLRGSDLDEIILSTINPTAVAALRSVYATRTQALKNDMASGEDLLDIDAEVSSLAEVLLLRDVDPPLVVGILGGWGSGKSFVMHLMQRRMTEIRGYDIPENQGQTSETTENGVSPFPYVGHVYLIEFDAWTYAKSNLWASLMQTVFFELSRQLALEKRLFDAGVPPLEGGRVWRALYDMTPGQRDALLTDALAPEVLAKFADQTETIHEPDQFLWDTLGKLKQDERVALEETEKQLAEATAALEKRRQNLISDVEAEIDEQARNAAWEPFESQLRSLLGEAFDRFDAQVMQETNGASLRTIPFRRQYLKPLIERNWPEYFAFALFFLATLLTPFLLDRLDTYGFPGFALAFGSVVATAMRTLDKWRGTISSVHDDYQLQVGNERSKLEAQRSQMIEQKRAEQIRLASEDPEDESLVPVMEQKVALLEAQAERHRQRVGLTARYVSLSDFVTARLDDAFYEKQLGLMHQVQLDLQELTEGLVVPRFGEAGADPGDFPRGPARVVLFIDDLDRCPPDKVVEVLEATQLLMKTSLFVVVLGMDERFITRALEKTYARILTRKGGPSGLDYIEKIVQIPYRLRPIDDTALDGYLSNQMRVKREPKAAPAVIQPNGDHGILSDQIQTATQPQQQDPPDALPNSVLEFSEDEFGYLIACVRQVELTPRALKRLINVYKLLKIIWYRPGHHTLPSRELHRLVLLLLALTGRYPRVMRGMLEALEVEVLAGSAIEFREFIKAQVASRSHVDARGEGKQLLSDVLAMMPSDGSLLSPTVRINQMDNPTFNLIRSFSFIGDIGYDPGDIAIHVSNGHASISSATLTDEPHRQGPSA